MISELIMLLKTEPWILLVGILTSIILGAVKTPIYKKCIEGKKDIIDEAKYKKRENLFDTIVFFSTFITALGGAVAYYYISKKFGFGKYGEGSAFTIICQLDLLVWLAQSLAYGFWKKFGFKRFLELIAKLFVKDHNKDGKVTLEDAVIQVKKAYKNGKLDIDTLLQDAGNTAVDNVGQVLETLATEGEVDPTRDAVIKAAEGDSTELKEVMVDKAEDLVTEVKEVVTKESTEEVIVADKKTTLIF